MRCAGCGEPIPPSGVKEDGGMVCACGHEMTFFEVMTGKKETR